MNLKAKFNIAAINCCTEAEGPYKRFTIWFQGCNIGCKGCCNKDYQALKARNIISLDKLVKMIEGAKEKYNIEGVTYSGGEPTLQYNLPLLSHEIQKLGLGIISFTGHKYEDVKDRLEGVDLVIDGEYIENQKEENRIILGSTNQRLICLSDRYRDCLTWFNSISKKIEISLGEKLIINGDIL